MPDYLIFFLVVLGVNLLPAFGPPTWSVIVVYTFNSNLSVPALVIVGAIAAALGRYLLALAFRHFGSRLSKKTRRNLDALREALLRKKRNAILGLGLFALSPVPSAQLFEAAGLARIPLIGFTLAFFAGRLVSYSIYAFTANSVRETSLGDTLRSSFSSPWGIAIQVAMIVGLVALARVDWEKRLGKE